MENMLLFYLVILLLIYIGVSGFLLEWQRFKRKRTISSILDPQTVTVIKTDTKKSGATFEKIIMTNNQLGDFFRQLQNSMLWKAYAIISLFSIFVFINSLMNFITLRQDVALIILLIVLVVVILLPEKVADAIIKKRIRRLSNDIPYLIDLLAIMVQSGMTIEAALRYVKDKILPINRDIASVLDRACIRLDINGIDSAVSFLNNEVPSREMRMLCTTLLQSIHYGSPIYQTLMDLSAEIREMQILETEEKISALSAKMTVPMMIFILFPMLVLIVGPVIAKLSSMFGS